MDQATSTVLDLIIVRQEGGYRIIQEPDGSDDGWTFAGITRTTWKDMYEADYSIGDINRMLLNDRSGLISKVWDVYEKKYVLPLQLSEFDITLHGPLLSAAINLGLEGATRILQVCIDPAASYIKIDGIMGPATIYAYYTNKQRVSVTDFLYIWMRDYVRICVAKPEKLRDLEGWLNRVEYWRYYIPPAIAAAAGTTSTKIGL